jgi:predicted O-linked N-acetylglucosamine transferase (SPINDLY family)
MATITEAFAVAQRHHRAGRLAQAERAYRQILAADPGHAGSLQLLGVIAHQSGQSDAALDLIGRALAADPGSAAARINFANLLKDLGKLEQAITHYQRALDLEPDNGELHYSIGVAAQLLGETDRAMVHYQRALALRPDIVEANLNLGTILADRGDLDAAISRYRRALELRPDYLAAHMNLGIALSRQHDPAAAMACFERAAELAPDHAPAHLNLGMSLVEQGRPEAALRSCERAIALAPADAEAYLSCGAAFAALGKFDEAQRHYERALALRPGYAAAHMSLGAALREQGRLDEAVAQFRQALDQDPALADAHYNLGLISQELGRPSDATRHLEHALAVRPDHWPAKFARCMTELPVLYSDEAEIAIRRAAYRERLEALGDEIRQGSADGELAAAVGSNQPFFLAYQQQNDRDLQSLYGTAVCRIMAETYPPPARPPRRLGGRVRVGFVSGFFCWHTVWKLFIRGWAGRLDRRKFQVFGYHTGGTRDASTTAAAGLCERFVPGPLTAERWRETILADAPDVLIYPEVGMDAMAGWLAAQRLAPTQCVAWGHPETSGLPTLDYFLTSAAMEPADSREHYTERLIALPDLSIYYEPLEVRSFPLTRSELGLRSRAALFWCGQSLYKYLPQYDCVFPRIAAELDDCQFVFVRYPHGEHVTDLFRRRLDRAFSAYGLDAADHCVILPVLDQQRFVAAAGLCDIVLDSIGWSGGVTSLEALTYDLPIVTLPGALMRGRHSMAMLGLMGVTDTIAATLDEYVRLALRLACDQEWRTSVRHRIAGAKHRLYRDDACISALEEFLLSTASKGGAADPGS